MHRGLSASHPGRENGPRLQLVHGKGRVCRHRGSGEAILRAGRRAYGDRRASERSNFFQGPNCAASVTTAAQKVCCWRIMDFITRQESPQWAYEFPCHRAIFLLSPVAGLSIVPRSHCVPGVVHPGTHILSG